MVMVMIMKLFEVLVLYTHFSHYICNTYLLEMGISTQVVLLYIMSNFS